MAKKKKSFSLFRWFLHFVLLGVALTVGAGAFAWHSFQTFTQRTVVNEAQAKQTIEVKQGDSLRAVLRRIQQQGLMTEHEVYWRALAKKMNIGTRLHVGEYQLKAGQTAADLLTMITSSEDVIQYRVTLIEGHTLKQIRASLQKVADLKQTLPDINDATLIKQLGIEHDSAEGWFLPETYQFVKGESDFDVLKRAHQAMKSKLDAAWQKRDKNISVKNPYEALILASIVEKETGQHGERARIAGVFDRRMKIGMKLQTDPTVIYGIGDAYNGNITRKHLTTPTPWNTYTIPGLPPTPIAMPGAAAIDAVMHPADGKALYFVARGDGSHHFSKSLREHNNAVRKYQLKR